MKTKLFTMMSLMVVLVVMLPTAINAKNPAGGRAPVTVNLQCSASKPSVMTRMVFGKPKFVHKVTVSITNGPSWIPSGTFINYSVNGLETKNFKVGGELGIPPFSKMTKTYSVILDDLEIPWPDSCAASYTN